MEHIVDAEFSEDGAVRLLMTRLSDEVGRDGERLQQIFDMAMPLYVRRLLGLLEAIAQRTGYLGEWRLAVGATHLGGMTAFSNDIFGRSRGSSFDEDVYRRATAANYAEIAAAPGAVTLRLAGRFLRTLGTNARNASLLHDPQPLDPEVGTRSLRRLQCRSQGSKRRRAVPLATTLAPKRRA